jgi:hypothetical protein
MENGTRNVILGVSLEKFVDETLPDELEFPRVITLKQGQAGAQGVLVNDRVVAVNGWWLPPAGHTRLWRTFRQLQAHYLGLDLKAPVQMVEMTWARALAEAEPNVDQQAAQAAAYRGDAAVEAPSASVQAPVVEPAPQSSSASVPPDAPVEAPVTPASPTSVADTDEANAQTSVIGSPTEVAHSSDVDMQPRAEETTEVVTQPAEAAAAAESQPPAAPHEEMS